MSVPHIVDSARPSRLAGRMFNRPLCLTPTAAALLGADGWDDDIATPERPAYTIVDGVAIIRVHGLLLNRDDALTRAFGLTTYDSLKADMDQAARDPKVVQVVLDFDSSGGEAAGALETADAIAALDRVKPVTAFVNSLAASAAYWLATGAREIVMTPLASVGSVGIVWLHLDESQALASAGLKPTIMHSGAYKVDGNALSPLEAAARGRIQAQLDQVYDLFTASVGARRPKLGQKGARATEAGIFIGEKAVTAGLADRVAAAPLRTAPTAARTAPVVGAAVAAHAASPPIAPRASPPTKAERAAEKRARANALFAEQTGLETQDEIDRFHVANAARLGAALQRRAPG